MKPFTLADIGKPVRVVTTGEHGEVRQVSGGRVLLFTDRGFRWFDGPSLERGHYETVWVPHDMG